MAMEDMAIISLKNYDDALTAAKEKSGNSAAMTSAELAGRIRSIPEQKPEQTKSVTYTTNGIHKVSPDSGKVLTGVTVNTQVPSKKPVVQPLTVTENGTYNHPAGVDGFAPVTVNVASTSKSLSYFIGDRATLTCESREPVYYRGEYEDISLHMESYTIANLIQRTGLYNGSFLMFVSGDIGRNPSTLELEYKQNEYGTYGVWSDSKVIIGRRGCTVTGVFPPGPDDPMYLNAFTVANVRDYTTTFGELMDKIIERTGRDQQIAWSFENNTASFSIPVLADRLA